MVDYDGVVVSRGDVVAILPTRLDVDLRKRRGVVEEIDEAQGICWVRRYDQAVMDLCGGPQGGVKMVGCDDPNPIYSWEFRIWEYEGEMISWEAAELLRANLYHGIVDIKFEIDDGPEGMALVESLGLLAIRKGGEFTCEGEALHPFDMLGAGAYRATIPGPLPPIPERDKPSDFFQ